MKLDKLKQMVIDNSTKKDLLEEIERLEFENFGLGWRLDDIIYCYEQKKKKCSKKKARQVADFLIRKADFSTGINWQYLNDSIDNYESQMND